MLKSDKTFCLILITAEVSGLLEARLSYEHSLGMIFPVILFFLNILVIAGIWLTIKSHHFISVRYDLSRPQMNKIRLIMQNAFELQPFMYALSTSLIFIAIYSRSATPLPSVPVVILILACVYFVNIIRLSIKLSLPLSRPFFWDRPLLKLLALVAILTLPMIFLGVWYVWLGGLFLLYARGSVIRFVAEAAAEQSSFEKRLIKVSFLKSTFLPIIFYIIFFLTLMIILMVLAVRKGI